MGSFPIMVPLPAQEVPIVQEGLEVPLPLSIAPSSESTASLMLLSTSVDPAAPPAGVATNIVAEASVDATLVAAAAVVSMGSCEAATVSV